MLELSKTTDDRLPILSVGEWSRDKHHFLTRYIDAFTTAMGPKRWSSLHYIDLFAGPGLLRLDSSRELIWGSPTIAAHCEKFDSLHLCEINEDYFKALKARIDVLDPKAKALLYNGDANVEVVDIVKRIPPKSLALAFLDPYGLHLHFKTLEVLSRHRTDLIIFFPDHLDALRNCEYVYRDKPNSNLDKVLGSNADWRSLLKRLPRPRWAEVLRKLYVEQIRSLGYTEFEYERISNPAGPLYLLIFCSKHRAGSKIWRGISGTKRDGQRTLDYGA